MQKILIDTDIGDDVDDVLALAYAIKSNALDVVGITSVYKNTALRARQIKKLLSLCGIPHIPVYAGYGIPMSGEDCTDEVFCQYTSDLDSSEYDYENMEEGSTGERAVDFIIDCVKKYGRELTIVAIGPLTNMAKAVLKDPNTMKNVGKVCLMAGDYRNQYAEWNVLCDMHAARIFFESGLPIYCAGHDITSRFVLSDKELERLYTPKDDELVRYLQEMVRVWMKYSRRNPILHDPLTIHLAIQPEHFVMDEIKMRVEVNGEFTSAMTVDVSSKYPDSDKYRVSVVRDVDRDLFVNIFMNTVFPGN